ncbi:MAG: DUF4861 family protein [Candidatus Latescibacteria bacterium]|nr:DUF4861 family protein [Candidatus Latescibacterota bacterium]
MVMCVPFSCVCMSAIAIVFSAVIFGTVQSGFSQKLDDPPVKFGKKIDITVTNPVNISRPNEPVVISINQLKRFAPDFNGKFFRVKQKTTTFEPLDIPSQIRSIPGTLGGAEELVFQLNLAPKEKKTVELQYNPKGTDLPDYPARTQSFGKWYRDGSNSAWENEIIAYRYYYGMVDYFGKSYPGLCLDKLLSDSYHHERLWGQDPYAVGKTPGLGGIALIEGDRLTPCYGYPDDVPYTYTYTAIIGGPVCAGVVMKAEDNTTKNILVEAATVLFNGRYENKVVATATPAQINHSVSIAPGMKKFDDEHITVDERDGFMFAWGIPVEEYGTVGTAFIWNPDSCSGIYETDNARYVKLTSDDNGLVSYLTLAVWYRASADQPKNQDALIKLVNELSLGFRNPVNVEIT